VLSSEVDLAEIRLIRYVVIKERGSEVFRKIRLSPQPFKVTAPSCTVIGNQAPNCQLRSKAHTALTAPWLYKDWQMRNEKFWNHLPTAD
jgi:hypothetical protein